MLQAQVVRVSQQGEFSRHSLRRLMQSPMAAPMAHLWPKKANGRCSSSGSRAGSRDLRDVQVHAMNKLECC